MSLARVVLEVNGGQREFASAGAADWQPIVDALRAELATVVKQGRCASAVISVHFIDERCEHEHGGDGG